MDARILSRVVKLIPCGKMTFLDEMSLQTPNALKPFRLPWTAALPTAAARSDVFQKSAGAVQLARC